MCVCVCIHIYMCVRVCAHVPKPQHERKWTKVFLTLSHILCV